MEINKINCDENQKLMSRSFDKDLTEPESDAMNGHTDECPDCAGILSEFEQLTSALEDLNVFYNTIEPRMELVNEIKSTLKKEVMVLGKIGPSGELRDEDLDIAAAGTGNPSIIDG